MASNSGNNGIETGDEAAEKDPLTDRQRQALDFISGYISNRGFPPTLREIGSHMGIRSTNGVNDHLKALEKKGYLEREDLKSRALRPLDPYATHVAHDGDGEHNGHNHHNGYSNHNGHNAHNGHSNHGGHNGHAHGMSPSNGNAGLPLTGQMVDVPLLGRVAAGEPILAVEQAEDSVKVDRFFLGSGPREVFALRVKGDSMIEAGIFDGDFIFVRKQVTAERGEVVVAMIDGDATVKYYHPEGDTIVFKPANRAYQNIVVRRRDWKTVNLLGVVVGIYRKL